MNKIIKADNKYIKDRYLLWVLVGIYGIINLITHLFNFNYVVDRDVKFMNVKNYNNSDEKALQIIGSVGSILGASSMVLIAGVRYTGLIHGIIYNMILGAYNIKFNNSGESLMNVMINIPILIICLFTWYLNMNKEEGIIKTKIIKKWWQYMIIVVLTAGIVVGYYYIIEDYSRTVLETTYKYRNNLNKILESFVNGLQTMGNILMITINMEAWVLIIISAILGIINNSFTLNINNIAINALLLITAVYGLFNWNKGNEIKKSNIEITKNSKFKSKVIIEDEENTPPVSVSKYHKEISTKSTFKIEDEKREEVIYTQKIKPVEIGKEREIIKGVIIGRFMPLHKGHIEFIDKVLKQCTELHIIMLCRHDDEVDEKIRANWIGSLYNDVRIYAVKSEIEEEDDRIWINQLGAIIKFKPEKIFISKELEGKEEIEKRIGVKIERIECENKIRSKKIRINVNKYFNELANSAKSYYARRFIILDDIAVEVARQIDVPYVEKYIEDSKEDNDKNRLTNNELIEMAKYQNQLEEINAEYSEGKVVCRSDSLMVIMDGVENNINEKTEKEIKRIYSQLNRNNRIYIIIGKKVEIETFLISNNVKVVKLESSKEIYDIINDL